MHNESKRSFIKKPRDSYRRTNGFVAIHPPQCRIRNPCNLKVSYIFAIERLFIFYEMKRDAFRAIADPTRREILGIIANEPHNVNSVTENFEISRTAIYKHIKILTQCGLIVIKQQGRERYCEAKMEKLHEVSDWVGQYRKYWEAKMDSLEVYLSAIQSKKIKKCTKGKLVK